MTYALSFAPDFFWGNLTGNLDEIRSSKRPTSVSQALVSLSQQEIQTLAREVFHTDPEYLDIATIIDRIRETNTCRNLDSPVEVFVDPDGEFVLSVYDSASGETS